MYTSYCLKRNFKVDALVIFHTKLRQIGLISKILPKFYVLGLGCVMIVKSKFIILSIIILLVIGLLIKYHIIICIKFSGIAITC